MNDTDEHIDFSGEANRALYRGLLIPEAALYVHVPFCKNKCAYCDFYSVTGETVAFFLSKEKKSDSCSRFIKKILTDVDDITSLFHTEHFSSIYIGGGTPSLLSSEDIFYLARNLIQKAVPHAECTIELNPESVSSEFIDTAIEGGINRFSLGVQTFSAQILQSQNRITALADIENALQVLYRVQKTRHVKVSCDLIVGFPSQTAEQVRADIRALLQYEIHHISVYTLCTADAQYDRENDAADFLFDCAEAELCNAGFTRYEVSNFAQGACYESAHNKAYWHLQPYFGVGPSAVGTFFLHSDGGWHNRLEITAVRTAGYADVNGWFQTRFPYTVETISSENEIKDFLLMGLRLREGIDKTKFFTRFHVVFDDMLAHTIKKFSRMIAVNTDKKFSLTNEGINFLSQFLVESFCEIENFFRSR